MGGGDRPGAVSRWLVLARIQAGRSLGVAAAVALGFGALAGRAAAQADGTRADTARAGSTARAAEPAFRFSQEAGLGLRALWEESLAAKEERVACLGASIRNDTVHVERILALTPQEADSLSVAAEASIERCGPPAWSGTVHTHVALYHR